jgi:hypothetical protein
MSHPAVQDWAEAIADATRRGKEIEAHVAASHAEVTELLSTSRAAIARSREILDALCRRQDASRRPIADLP